MENLANCLQISSFALDRQVVLPLHPPISSSRFRLSVQFCISCKSSIFEHQDNFDLWIWKQKGLYSKFGLNPIDVYLTILIGNSTQFLETLSGLAHIRAFGWQKENHLKNDMLLDTSQRPFYQLFMIQQWLNLVLQLICAGLAFLVVVLAVELRSTVSPGFTGVALVNIINLALNMADVINS